MAEDGEDAEALAQALTMSMEPAGALVGADSSQGALQTLAAKAPETPFSSAVQLLRKNSIGALADAGTVQVISTLLNNLATSPTEEKYRKIRLSNNKIAKALSCSGAEAMLLASGFSKGDGVLEISATHPNDQVAASARNALEALDWCGPFLLSAQLAASQPVRCVCALPGGGLATGAMDNMVRIYTPDYGSTLQQLVGHERRAGSDGVLALSTATGAATSLFSGGRDGKIIHWRDGTKVEAWTGHGQGIQGTNVHVVSCLAHTSDGLLISGGWDKTVRLWDGSREVQLLEGHTVAVNAVIGLPCGRIASASGDQTVLIWKEGQKEHTLSHTSPVRAICACGEHHIATAGNDGFVRLWNVESCRQLAQAKVADAYILALAFCASSGEIAAGADDGSLALLFAEDIGVSSASLRVAGTLQHRAEVYGAAFLGNGDLAVACGDSNCIVWTRNTSRCAPVGIRDEYTAQLHALAAARGAASSGGSAPLGQSWDFSFPVELSGRKLRLEWNRGEQAEAVAQRFCGASGLEMNQHRSDIVGFVQQQQSAGAGGMGAASVPPGASGTDFSYPVEVADGRRLTISWNRGDDPKQVALLFAQRNMIGADELPAIIDFIQQVSGTQPTFAQQAPSPSPAAQQQALLQVMEMGFDEQTARAALQGAGWSVEAAVQRLFG